MSDNPLERQMQRYMVELQATIDRCGHAVQGVMGDGPEPPFHYTVGRTLKGRPELVVIGLPYQVGGFLLNNLARYDDTFPLSAGDTVHGQLGEYAEHDIRVIEVTDVEGAFPLSLARRLYPNVTALQVVWTDFSDRFPWDAGYDVDPRIQPLLGPAPSGDTGQH